MNAFHVIERSQETYGASVHVQCKYLVCHAIPRMLFWTVTNLSFVYMMSARCWSQWSYSPSYVRKAEQGFCITDLREMWTVLRPIYMLYAVACHENKLTLLLKNILGIYYQICFQCIFIYISVSSTQNRRCMWCRVVVRYDLGAALRSPAVAARHMH